MSTSKADIRRWLERGKGHGATHMIVVCDTFDWTDYPVYVKPGQDPQLIRKKYDGKNMQKIMECYSYGRDLTEQLSEHRAFHWD